jgi:predicted ATP-grasp superfamily ATP-dependent carboligase
MNYYKFADLLQSQASAQPIYLDPLNDQYYQSSAELEGSTPTKRLVRTLLYSDHKYRDYEMNFDSSGNLTNVKPGPTNQKLCRASRPLTEEEKKIAIQASKALGLETCGVDILRSKNGPVIMEMNACAGLSGITKSSSVDVAKKLIEYAITLVS